MGTAARFLSQGLEPHHACRTAADARADARTGAADRRAAARDRRETRRSAARLGKLNRPTTKNARRGCAVRLQLCCVASVPGGTRTRRAAVRIEWRGDVER